MTNNQRDYGVPSEVLLLLTEDSPPRRDDCRAFLKAFPSALRPRVLSKPLTSLLAACKHCNFSTAVQKAKSAKSCKQTCSLNSSRSKAMWALRRWLGEWEEVGWSLRVVSRPKLCFHNLVSLSRGQPLLTPPLSSLTRLLSLYISHFTPCFCAKCYGTH